MMGHVVIAWMWLRQALAAHAALAAGADESFYRGKLQAAQYFFRHELPQVANHAKLLQGLDATTLEMKPDWF
jgi:hypothetical protein